jgi:hypothetical protein
MGGISEGVYKHSAGEMEPVISVYQEHGIATNHIGPAPTTHLVTQVGHTAMFVVVEKEQMSP